MQRAMLPHVDGLQSLDRATLGALARHSLQLLLDRSTDDELGEFGEAVLTGDLTAVSRLGSWAAAVMMRGAS